ncbi:uncharacterized protein LOC113330333 [Papaver somniferum]|uniref:uncharacterized protein LOC113330333 n=1 Tax=Papaver somniferum TaxID=3469 RepID=UPI000E6F6E6A|nr:uncharacterized protein LOC113330333 [Papaver somniferum]
MSTKLDRILNLLGVDLPQPSNMEESTISVEDITVSPSEEIKSTPPVVDDEKDSLELEYIPSFSLAENEADASIVIASFEFKGIGDALVIDFDRNNLKMVQNACWGYNSALCIIICSSHLFTGFAVHYWGSTSLSVEIFYGSGYLV